MKQQRRTFTKTQINSYMSKFNEFIGTKKAFCDTHNISIYTLTNWQREQAKSYDNSFIEIEIPIAEPLTPILTYGGFSLSNFDSIPQSKLIQILQSFKAANDVSTSTN